MSDHLSKSQHNQIGNKTSQDAHLREIIVDAQEVWTGSFLRAERLLVRLPNGRIASRDVIRHPGAVGIIALNDEGDVLLVHQYRAALDAITLEIPAGKVEPHEDPLSCAQRELAEETGYVAHAWKHISSSHTSPGFCDELIHLYLATNLEPHAAHPDDDEFVEAEFYSPQAVQEYISSTTTIDMKTLAGLLIAKLFASRCNDHI